MFQRAIENTLKKTVASFPVTVLLGPRQSGKTTLLRQAFPEYAYVSLESPDQLLRIQADPRGFLTSNQSKWIIDEAQHYPQLFSYLQEYVDQQPQAGRFILSGSQNFLLNEQVSQSLAGRTAILELLPLSYTEYMSGEEAQSVSLWKFLFQGGYPRPYHEKLDIDLWYQSYMRTYLERDVRTILQIKDLNKFQIFLKLCAGRHGQLLNLNALAQEAGISQTTATQWLTILEASYIVFRLQPYYRNLNKRLVKTPKLYFYDSAIVCRLLGIDSPQHLELHSSRGAIFEGFILAEIIKHYLAAGKRAALYFWRDQSGFEVDALIERGEQLYAIEIKSGMTILPEAFRNLERFAKLTAAFLESSYLVYGGHAVFNQNTTQVVPWNDLEQVILKNM